ncbi:methyltransferase [uncultured Croceitalea sp.]|uniref:tRNA1(Val) (adenine(37)-N6)-methyltransferase n=1 Tax=uncultured Croceitalea sp. TaxID=1798908 RepID=UPI003305604B
MSKPFIFKEFTINQDRCAMKVGTDGVLLGAWVSIKDTPNSILDIGAGTGLIALQMAQRSYAETVDAIELDDEAYEQCVENFEASQWSDRLFCYHASLQEFTEELAENYDLIVSNPPFYIENVTSGDKSRDKARQNLSLPFKELLDGVKKLLSNEGDFAVIIPFKEEKNFLKQAITFGLYVNRITHVKGNPDSEIKRSLLQFSFYETTIQKDELVIEIERHQYTKAYQELTAPFYLKM